MKSIKPSQVLASAGWLYVFVAGSLLILRTIPADGLSWRLFIFFFVLAVWSSAIAQGKTKVSPTDVRINMAGEIYTGEDLQVHLLKDGTMFVYIDLAHPSKNKNTGLAAPAQAPRRGNK